MKKIYMISFFLVLCLFATGFFIGLKQHKAKIEEPEMILPDISTKETGQNEIRTDCDTIWTIQSYDQLTDQTTTEVTTIPAQYIEQSRTQIETLLHDYQNAPSLSDLEKGFLTISLLDFSKEKVTILKTYDSDHKTEGYYLLLIDGKICVYLYDKKTMYFTTELQFEAMPIVIQQEIMQGKYFKEEKELYSFLESYTS